MTQQDRFVSLGRHTSYKARGKLLSLTGFLHTLMAKRGSLDLCHITY